MSLTTIYSGRRAYMINLFDLSGDLHLVDDIFINVSSYVFCLRVYLTGERVLFSYDFADFIGADELLPKIVERLAKHYGVEYHNNVLEVEIDLATLDMLLNAKDRNKVLLDVFPKIYSFDGVGEILNSIGFDLEDY